MADNSQKVFEAAVNEMIGASLAAVGAETLFREFGYVSELGLLFAGNRGLVEAFERRSRQRISGQEYSEEFKTMLRQAAAICLLADYGSPYQGLRVLVFGGRKGQPWMAALREAGLRLWKDSGQTGAPTILPLIGEDGRCLGFVPEIPTLALREMLVAARAGLKKSQGAPVKERSALILGDAPPEHWRACIVTTLRLIKEGQLLRMERNKIAGNAA